MGHTYRLKIYVHLVPGSLVPKPNYIHWKEIIIWVEGIIIIGPVRLQRARFAKM